METELKKIRRIILIFIFLLILSGITAFPIRTEIEFLVRHHNHFLPLFQNWILRLNGVIGQTPDIMLYGTDWLAFAHLVIALFFIGVYIDPIKNKFNVLAGMLACISVFPLAFIMGAVRGIPFFHQLIDCSFGLLGLIPLYIIYKKITQIELSYVNSVK